MEDMNLYCKFLIWKNDRRKKRRINRDQKRVIRELKEDVITDLVYYGCSNKKYHLMEDRKKYFALIEVAKELGLEDCLTVNGREVELHVTL